MPKIEISGKDDALKYLSSKKRKIDENADAGVNKATIYLQGKIKESIARGVNAPVTVDTGRFLNSIDIASKKSEGYVFTDVPYAPFLEYGTSKIAPRPHFRNTQAKENNKVQKIIQEEVNNI